MKSVTDVYNSVWNQQLVLLKVIKNTIYSSGNLKGIPQWRDRKRFYQLEQKYSAGDYLLCKKSHLLLWS